VADFSNSTLPDPLSASTRIDARRPSGFNALRTGRHGKTVKHAHSLRARHCSPPGAGKTAAEKLLQAFEMETA
jgi:hypothetical protein